MEFLYWIILILISAISGVLTFFFLKKREKERITGSLNMVLFLVTMPKHKGKTEETAQKEEKALIGQMEQVFSNFLYLKKPGFLKQAFSGVLNQTAPFPLLL